MTVKPHIRLRHACQDLPAPATRRRDTCAPEVGAWADPHNRYSVTSAGYHSYRAALDAVDAHYSGSLDHQPAYVRIVREALQERPGAAERDTA